MTARRALEQGTGVIVIGSRGWGRSRFVHELVNDLAEPTRSRLRLVEEVHDLDDDRARQLAAAVTREGAIPVVTALSRRVLPEALEELRRRGALVTVECAALSARELVAFAESAWGRHLDSRTASLFIPARGGSDLTALREALSRTPWGDGVAPRTGHSTPPAEYGSLRRLIVSRGLRPSSDANVVESLLDVVALAPDLGLTTVVRVATQLGLGEAATVEGELERLEDLGLLELVPRAGGPRVRLLDGLQERLLPLTIGVLRRRRLTSAIVEALAGAAPTELDPEELVARTQFALELGLDESAEALTLAARASLRGPETDLSLRLAHAAIAAGGGFDAEMACAAAESQAGLADDAMARLRRVADDCADDLQRTDALRTLSRLVHERASDPQAAELLREVAPDGAGTSSPRLDATKGFMLYSLGDPLGAADLLRPALGGLEGAERGEAQFQIASADLILGQVTQALAALDEAEADFASVGADASRVHLLRANADVLAGRIPSSLAVVTAFRDAVASFGDPVAQAMCSWALGGLLLSSGRVGRAVAELRLARRILEEGGIVGTSWVVRTDLATALAASGDHLAAQEALPPVTVLDVGIGFALTGKYRDAEGWIHAAAGRPHEAAAAFEWSAESFGTQGYTMLCVIELISAARAGRALQVIDRIEALVEDMDGVWLDVEVRFARALAVRESLDAEDGSPVAHQALADEFMEVGRRAIAIDLHMVAAEAFDHASAEHRRAGDDRASAASARLREEQIAECGLMRLPLMTDRTAVTLSGREGELARLASSGLSNREIADQLVLSVRTVETHLQQVYRKLGIRGRSELGEAMGSPAQSMPTMISGSS